MSRMGQILGEDLPTRVRIFTDADEAAAWLVNETTPDDV